MKIGCVLIAYNPDAEILAKSLTLLSPQVEEIFLGDNTPNANLTTKNITLKFDNILYNPFNCNIGIAAGQNKGIEYFTKKGYDYILFMDQDSLVTDNMVASLCRDIKWLTKQGFNVGGIGPQPINKQNGRNYTTNHLQTITDKKLAKVDQLISSASLIPIQLFKQVGMMDESLFIDGVDYEWCWRAHTLAHVDFFISLTTQLAHQLGEGDKFFLYRPIAITPPFRIYYQFRNYIWLLHRKYVPLKWKIKNGLKYLIKVFYYSLLSNKKQLYINRMFYGIKDGLSKKNNYNLSKFP